MHVLFLSSNSFDEHYSSYHLMEGIIAALLDSGHSVSLIQKSKYDNPPLPDKLQSSDLTVDSLKSDSKKNNAFLKRYMSEVRYFQNAGKIIKQRNLEKCFDVVFIQSTNALWAAIRSVKNYLDVPIVYNEQDLFPDNALYAGLFSDGAAFKLLSRIQKCSYEKCTEIITVSEDMAKQIIRHTPNKQGHISVVHNWCQELPIDYRDSDNPIEKRIVSSKQNLFKVVYAGTIGRLQDIICIIKAAEILRDVKDVAFFIVGSGSSKKEIEEKVAASNLSNVTLWDKVDSTAAPYLYSFADVNLIPLIKGGIKTCLPSKTSVCIASGRPLIALVDCDSFFARTIKVYPGSFVIEPGDVAELAKTILSIKEKYGFHATPNTERWCEGSGDDYCAVLERTARCRV